MTELVLLGANCEATGHPDECDEPSTGTVVEELAHNVTINDIQIGAIDTADIHFPEHSHDHTIAEGCHDNQSHTLDPLPENASSSITIDGSPVYVVRDGVVDDPITGGDVNIIDAGGNTTITESEP